VSFRYLPHTADLRAELRGRDRAALYQAAVDLVRDIAVGGDDVEPREVREMTLVGDDSEALYRFVRELVFALDADGFLPARVELAGPPDTVPGAVRVGGEAFDRARHHVQHQIKAVTRHAYEYGPLRDGSGLRAQIVFDL
jgi:SHS2 domain-containing protein